jgi:hypothetical protein
MREDMGKVLVESPRLGRSGAKAVEGSRRKLREHLEADDTALSRIGMRRDAKRRKHFAEHLGPLYRYLRRQANRPWDKVYGELCAQLDRRNVVQDHLFQHIEDRVAVQTELLDGEVCVREWNRTLVPVKDSRHELFVHPRTGLLLVNRGREQAARKRREKRAAEAREREQDRRVGVPGLPRDCQLLRLEGEWYEVRFQELPPDGYVFDVVLRGMVCMKHHATALWRRHGVAHCYAAVKQQLDRKALERHGLR